MCSFEGIDLHIHKNVIEYIRREMYIRWYNTNDKSRCGI